MKPPILPGYAVFSKKGRDKGRYFVVLYTVDADFAVIADGDTRKIDHPKKKRLKHLAACPHEFPEIVEKYQAGQLMDSDIRRALSSVSNATMGERAPTENREG